MHATYSLAQVIMAIICGFGAGALAGFIGGYARGRRRERIDAALEAQCRSSAAGSISPKRKGVVTMARVFVAVAVLALGAVAYILLSGGESKPRPSKSAAEVDECGGCKVEMISPDKLRQEQMPDGRWKHIGHRCVGASRCADSCQVDNCFSSSDDVEPMGCDHCSAGK